MSRFVVAAGLLIIVVAQSCAGGRPAVSRGAIPISNLAQAQSIAELACPPQADPAVWEQLKAALQVALAAMPGVRNASGVPSAAAGAVQDLTLTPRDDETLQCMWTYRNTGDYDQSGEVNVEDLVPIGLHFGATSTDVDWPAAQLADGDQNGEVNIADVTPIARNWQGRIDGYLIRRSASASLPSAWADIARVEFADGQAPENGGPLQFSLVLDTPYPGRSYGATAYMQLNSGIDVGPASNAPRFDPPLPVAPSIAHAAVDANNWKIDLAWDPVPWALSYWIFKDGQDQPIAKASVCSWADSSIYDIAVHSYQVCGVNSTGQGAVSAVATGQKQNKQGDWYMARHDARRTCRTHNLGPEHSTLLWSYLYNSGRYICGPVFSSDGVMYLNWASESNADAPSALLSLADNMQVNWDCVLPGIHSYSPAIARDGSILTSFYNGFFSLNPDSTQRYQVVSLPGPSELIPGVLAVDASDSMYFNDAADGYSYKNIVKISADGNLVWRGPEEYWTNGVPSVSDDGACYVSYNSPLFTSDKRGLLAVDSSGQRLWSFPTEYQVYCSPCIGDDGTVYFTSTYEQCMFALNPDGTEKWRFPLQLVNSWVSIQFQPSPALGWDGTIYAGIVQGVLYAVNPDGSQKWALELWQSNAPALCANYGCVFAVDGAGVIYFVTYEGYVIAVNPDGTEKWRYDEKEYAADQPYFAPVIGPGGRLYVPALDGTLYCFGDA